MQGSEKKHQPIKVFIRQRPFTQNEIESKCGNIIQKISPKELTIKSGFTEKKYNFDRVFGEEATQLEVYNAVLSPLINHIVLGYNCTVFAYGQTGTGKTHTIIGKNPVNLNVNFLTDLSIGIIPRACAHLFSELNMLNPKIEYTVRASFIEIYNEEVRDLLSESAPLRIYDDAENKGSVYIKGLSEVTVCNPQEVHEWLNVGLRERQNAATNFNTRSSRSHVIFILLVNTREIMSDGEEIIKTGKLLLADLAGSENMGKSGVVDFRAREAVTINKSLQTLGKVITALAQKMQHVPYRESKLTRILQDSLGGGCRTCMIGTISPSSNAWDETVSTLDYAHFTKSIVNCPQVNINRKRSNFLIALETEMKKLQNELATARGGSGFYISSKTYSEMVQKIDENQEKITELIDQIAENEERKRTKEDKYQSLTESFEKTKTYLDAAKKELALKKQENKENDFFLNHALKRDEQLQRTASELLKICEVSTKHEDIYHSKYQSQCDATLSNAAIARDVTELCFNFFKEIQNLADLHKQSQDHQTNEIKNCVKRMKDTNAQGLQQITEVTTEMHLDNKLKDVLKHEKTDFSESGIQNYFTSLNFLQPKRQDKIKNSLESLKKHIVTTSTKDDNKHELCVDAIDNAVSQKQENLSGTKAMLEEIQQGLMERNNRIQNEIEQNRKIRSIIKEHIARTREEDKVVLEEALSLKQKAGHFLQMVETYKAKKLSMRVKESTADYLESRSGNAKTQISLLADVTNNIEENRRKIQNETIADAQDMNKYLSSLTETINENLTKYNNGVRNVWDNWKEKTTAVTDTLFKSVTENSEVIDKSVELISESTRTYRSDVKTLTENTAEDARNLQKNITFTTHVGDTPVKITHNCPKRLEPAVPKHVLLEQMKQAHNEEF